MKYKTIIETDDFEDFEFFEDGNGKYIHGIDAGAVNNEWIAMYFTECNQENVLDKIRAEIFAEMQYHSGTGEEVIQAYADGLKKGLDILDKYKAESEE